MVLKNVAKPPKHLPKELEKGNTDRVLNDIENETEKSHKKLSKVGPAANDQGVPYNYVVVIDAGSKGSRAYVYNFLDAGYMYKKGLLKQQDAKSPELHLVERIDSGGLPQLETHSKWTKKIRPGLSSFEDKAYEDQEVPELSEDNRKYLQKLLKRAKKVVPKDAAAKTPVFVHATAGMRLLSDNQQTAILGATCRYLKDKTPFYVGNCDDYVRIIDGDEEGLFAWIAMNYLSESLKDGQKTHGLLDLGGASTQVSFEPVEAERKEHSSELMTLRLGTVGATQPDLEYQIYSTSFLGYGMYQMHLKYLAAMADADPEGDGYLDDPCMPANYKNTVTLNDREYKVTGTANYDKCQKDVYETFAKASDCDSNQKDVDNCLVDDKFPAFDINVDSFYGVSGYWDTISKLLSLGDAEEEYGKVYSYTEIEEETKKVCSLDWKTLQKYKDVESDELAELCFKSTYILNLLHNGLGLDKSDGKNKEPFQVNDKINGADFTWTLGRAVLYASDEGMRQVRDLKGVDEADSAESEASVYTGVGYFRNAKPDEFTSGADFLLPQNDLTSKAQALAQRVPHSPSAIGILLFFILIIVAIWKRSPVLRFVQKLYSKGSQKVNRYRNVHLANDPESQVEPVEREVPLDDLQFSIDDDDDDENVL